MIRSRLSMQFFVGFPSAESVTISISNHVHRDWLMGCRLCVGVVGAKVGGKAVEGKAGSGRCISRSGDNRMYCDGASSDAAHADFSRVVDGRLWI